MTEIRNMIYISRVRSTSIQSDNVYLTQH